MEKVAAETIVETLGEHGIEVPDAVLPELEKIVKRILYSYSEQNTDMELDSKQSQVKTLETQLESMKESWEQLAAINLGRDVKAYWNGKQWFLS